MKILTNSLTKLTILTVVLLTVLTVNYLRAFNGPPGVAPYCPTGSPGCDAPINSGDGLQEKSGDLKIKSLWSTTSILSSAYYLNVGPDQVLYGDAGAYGKLIWKSGHADRTQVEFIDANNVSYGKVFGGSTGLEFGLRDRNNNWSYRAVTDNTTPANSMIDMQVNGDTKMAILSDGKVGIGTLTPGAKLHVEGDMELRNSNPAIKFNDTDTGERNWQLLNGSNNLSFRTDRDADGSFSNDNPHPLVISNGGDLTNANDDYSTFANEVRANEYCDRSGDNCINPVALTLECVSGFRKDDTDKGIYKSTLDKTYDFSSVFNSGENITSTGDQPWLECKNAWVMTGCSSGTDGNVGGGDNDEAMIGQNQCRGDQIGDNKVSARCCRITM